MAAMNRVLNMRRLSIVRMVMSGLVDQSGPRRAQSAMWVQQIGLSAMCRVCGVEFFYASDRGQPSQDVLEWLENHAAGHLAQIPQQKREAIEVLLSMEEDSARDADNLARAQSAVQQILTDEELAAARREPDA